MHSCYSTLYTTYLDITLLGLPYLMFYVALFGDWIIRIDRKPVECIGKVRMYLMEHTVGYETYV